MSRTDGLPPSLRRTAERLLTARTQSGRNPLPRSPSVSRCCLFGTLWSNESWQDFLSSFQSLEETGGCEFVQATIYRTSVLAQHWAVASDEKWPRPLDFPYPQRRAEEPVGCRSPRYDNENVKDLIVMPNMKYSAWQLQVLESSAWFAGGEPVESIDDLLKVVSRVQRKRR